MNNNCGVYRIVNTENGKRYYGSSKNLRKRWCDHKSEMRLGTHGNPGIKEDAAIHGEAAFEFEVLCYCKPEERRRFEGAHIDQNLGEKCYNRRDGNGNYDHTEEAKAKISEAQKGRIHTEETKAKIGAAQKGKTLSEEHKAKISEAQKGKPKSEEHKANLSAALKGKPSPKRKVTCPHCGKEGGINVMKRWHFDKCDHKKTPVE